MQRAKRGFNVENRTVSVLQEALSGFVRVIEGSQDVCGFALALSVTHCCLHILLNFENESQDLFSGVRKSVGDLCKVVSTAWFGWFGGFGGFGGTLGDSLVLILSQNWQIRERPVCLVAPNNSGTIVSDLTSATFRSKVDSNGILASNSAGVGSEISPQYGDRKITSG